MKLPFEFYVSDSHPMYVQRWSEGSDDRDMAPVVLIHGGAHTGMFWTSCPDGRPGWAPLMAGMGRTIYVVDWPGIGRSPRASDFLTAGPAPCIEAIADLLKRIGPAHIVGHSIGAALAVKVADVAPDLVLSLALMNPAAPGTRESGVPVMPLDAPMRFDGAAIEMFFTNADRFPKSHVAEYSRSLCDLSPSIFNVIAHAGSDHALRICDLDRLRAKPSLVLAGDQDQLVSSELAAHVAEFANAGFVMVGKDWGFEGFGHMIPIEIGSEAILTKLLAWMDQQEN